MKRAQAALEFLTTYGWAFIVILVMIGALAYFGVLSPSKITPNRCIVEAGFECKDFRIGDTTINILINNRKGEGMTVHDVTVTSDAGIVDDVTCTPAGDTTVGSDQQLTITCDGGATSLLASHGSKVKVDFSINYTMARGTYSQIAEGSVYGPVQ